MVPVTRSKALPITDTPPHLFRNLLPDKSHWLTGVTDPSSFPTSSKRMKFLQSELGELERGFREPVVPGSGVHPIPCPFPASSRYPLIPPPHTTTKCRFNYIPGIPLVACASEGQSALLRHLLRQEGVDPGVRDLNGNTALGLATANGRSEAAGLLRTAQAAGAREDGVAAQGAPA